MSIAVFLKMCKYLTLSEFFFHQNSLLSFIFCSIKKIECIEWIELSIFTRKHNACTFYRSEIHIVSIHERDDKYSEDIIIAQFLRKGYVRKTAEETREAI